MLRVFPLGGLGEIGMNCLALEQRGQVLLIDCGITFDDRGLGIDVVHPDFSALDAYRDRIAGVFITHGHEDHIGALPYLLRRFDVPVWGPPYALGLVRERLTDHEVLAHARLIETRARTRYPVGSFEVEPVRVTHSIADATALAIRTDAGLVVHSGDFKIDDNPPDGEVFDHERLRELGDEGTALLFSDSTNVDSDGGAGSEQTVGDALEPIVAEAPGAVVVALFASNVHRLRMLGDIARRTGRRIVPLGRSILTHTRVAHDTGYLDWPSDLVFPQERVNELPRQKILGLATGTQAEGRAALARLARGEHPYLKLDPGDVVALSSRIIPGNEPEVYAVIGELLRRGVVVRTRVTDRNIHVSGHAHRGEQRRMLELVRPKTFIPVHGTIHHLMRHAELARECGVPDVCVIENGDVVEVARGEGEAADPRLVRRDRVLTGRVPTFAGRRIPAQALRERAWLAESGCAVVVVLLGRSGVHDVKVTTRGVLDESLDAEIVTQTRREVVASVGQELAREVARTSDETIAETARLAVRRTLFKALGFKPLTVVSVHHLDDPGSPRERSGEGSR
ncbi:ribonuclease J [Pendulispora albinea]|uniref:Ribonuclease J n=1 Tax=Pendulispora albinea TaxID=2741071 RepID=A0ABZ2M045_9BACT